MPARETLGCFRLGPVDGSTTHILCVLAPPGGPGRARGPFAQCPTQRQTWEARPHSGRYCRVSGLAHTPHQMVAFPGNGTQRWLSE